MIEFRYILVLVCVFSLSFVTSDFTNGDFESNSFNGWGKVRKCVPISTGFSQTTPQTLSALNLNNACSPSDLSTTPFCSTGPQSCFSAHLTGVAGADYQWPLDGNYAALLNFGGNNYNVNYLQQTITLSNADIDPVDNKIHIRFALLPILENPGHLFNQQPYYFASVTDSNGQTLAAEFKVSNQAGVPWTGSSTLKTLNWQLFDYISSGFFPGARVSLTILAAGCGLGGHYGEIYVDSITTQATLLSVIGTAPAFVAPCANLPYTLTYRNNLANTVTNVVVRFGIPASTTYVSVTPPAGVTCTAPLVGQITPDVVCTIPSLPSGGSGIIIIVVKVSCSATAPITTANYDIHSSSSPNVLGPLIVTQVTCQPKTCSQLGATCGLVSDGCGGTIDCGSCSHPTQPGASGDPQFVGLQGQSYQVHGADDTVFNLISYKSFVMNGRFTYIANGHCGYNNTLCWSHPGTYVSALGFRFLNETGESKVEIHAGSHGQGLSLTIDEDIIDVNQVSMFELSSLGSGIDIHVHGYDTISIEIDDLFKIKIINSDYFFNMEVACLRGDWLRSGSYRFYSPLTTLIKNGPFPHVPLHGLLGQTWKNILYRNGHVYEGDVMDYASDENDLYFVDHPYNQYSIGHQSHSIHKH